MASRATAYRVQPNMTSRGLDCCPFLFTLVHRFSRVGRIWGERVTTIFPRQGHYACDSGLVVRFPAADVTIERIGDLIDWDLAPLVGKTASGAKDSHG